MKPILTVRAFIERINAHDLDGLCRLMTEDHTFVDGGGGVVRGCKNMRQAWRDYFSMMPDYFIRVEHMLAEKNIVGIFGEASGTYTRSGQLKPENHWQVTAAWLAILSNGKVAHWQVYADNDSVSQIIARERAQGGDSRSST